MRKITPNATVKRAVSRGQSRSTIASAMDIATEIRKTAPAMSIIAQRIP